MGKIKVGSRVEFEVRHKDGYIKWRGTVTVVNENLTYNEYLIVRDEKSVEGLPSGGLHEKLYRVDIGLSRGLEHKLCWLYNDLEVELI